MQLGAYFAFQHLFNDVRESTEDHGHGGLISQCRACVDVFWWSPHFVFPCNPPQIQEVDALAEIKPYLIFCLVDGRVKMENWGVVIQVLGVLYAAESLKENLFKNLMNHSEFLTNTKLAISKTYKQTNLDFLESGKDTFCDDGLTASTTILVGNHLYVANVGDSRTVISKLENAIPLFVAVCCCRI
ncbi:hypothetical protein LXL04_025440 [Taraxacum kok-saghyz]